MSLSSIRTRLSQEIKDLIDSKQSAKDFIIFMNKTLLEKYKDNPNWDAFCYLENLQGLKEEHKKIDNQIEERQAKLALLDELEPLIVEKEYIVKKAEDLESSIRNIHTATKHNDGFGIVSSAGEMELLEAINEVSDFVEDLKLKQQLLRGGEADRAVEPKAEPGSKE